MSTLPTFAPTELPKLVYMDATSLLLGMMANWILFGVLVVQFYLYYISFPKDYRAVKLVVCAQLLLETTQTVMFTRDIVQHFTQAYTDPAGLNEVGTLWLSITLMIGLIAFITQGFYCYRVGVLTKSKYAVALIGMLSLAQLSAAISASVLEERAVLLTTLLSQNATLTAIGIWGGCSLACDIVIATIMTYHLRRWDTRLGNTHSMIVRLVRLSVETGCLTALSAGVLLVLVYLPGPPPYYTAAGSLVSKTYSNSMMAILNSRIKPVSNAPAFEAPLWNELVNPNGTQARVGGTQGIVFCRDRETEFSASSSSNTAP
ncbi:hypothetical protein HYPSUDRAFT_34813 [Hypholoma sublateritium FD-334 SS-4]|uniref:DUF6534 domain-containing protein n=1 Tax=Hypholoma sublateritium (strain FD-334 SS-4) TaxID=945553 RepID=A0A0D2LJA6_HYPSF|nr:hypothetical protein HYPSUDRAFT_34813 [Hypholoma sublateritium FD-334 SS-4]